MKNESITFLCLAAVVSTLAISTAQASSDVKPLKTISGLRLGLIDGSIVSNCAMNTPDLCQSRKGINISPDTTAYLKQTLLQMIPGQQRHARNQAEVKAINEENIRLKGSGEELKIAKNIERLVELQSGVHSEYLPLQFTPFLWEPRVMKFGLSKYDSAADRYDMGEYYHGKIDMNHVLNHPLARGDDRYLGIGDAHYTINRSLHYSYNPNMEMSFVVRIISSIKYPNESYKVYATEDLVARCEERRIYNTFATMKMGLSGRNLVCILPENLGSLRFKVVERL
jgi:hypothetical protein